MTSPTCLHCGKHRKIRARRLCGSCYNRASKNGDLPPRVRLTWREYLDQATGPAGTCWLWPGALNSNGYGLAFTDNGREYAHRVSWVERHGPIEDGLTIDHLCRNPACVNPDHLEVVTRGENLRRAVPYRSPQVSRLGRGACSHGDLDLYVDPSGKRVCRVCRRERTRMWRAEQAAN